jgi:diguanylate cyclase (GGDEF)-like protein
VPLAVQGEILGLLCLIGAATREDELQTSQQQLAVTAGETIKLSLSNLRLREKLREEAIHDILTGVFNRRYLEETLPRELYHAQRRNSPLCVAMLDLDHFKRFNDTFGHSAGDALLRELGQILRVNLRKSDISCRYGGEEFVLVLPDSSLEDTRQRIEQISVLVKNLQVWHRNKQLGTITMSVGIAVSPEHGSTASELLRAADNALYAAKQAGRDRVVVYEVSE